MAKLFNVAVKNVFLNSVAVDHDGHIPTDAATKRALLEEAVTEVANGLPMPVRAKCLANLNAIVDGYMGGSSLAQA